MYVRLISAIRTTTLLTLLLMGEFYCLYCQIVVKAFEEYILEANQLPKRNSRLLFK